MKVILVYDIDTTEKAGQRRLQKALKTARRYLHHVQKSVFEGSLTLSKLERLKRDMLRIVDKEKDSLIIYIFEDHISYHREILTNVKDPVDNVI
ncbi:MAG: CRISPR-associated endonuclease Cas2 [Thermodesulfobacteriaceae bacterium]|jgi:CRISPR-associated protein Cas2